MSWHPNQGTTSMSGLGSGHNTTAHRRRSSQVYNLNNAVRQDENNTTTLLHTYGAL